MSASEKFKYLSKAAPHNGRLQLLRKTSVTGHSKTEWHCRATLTALLLFQKVEEVQNGLLGIILTPKGERMEKLK